MTHYTTIEQSKKLLELGLNPESADMYYFLDPTPVGNIYHLTVKRIDVGIKNLPEFDKGDIPCWSVGALLEVMPKVIKKDKRYYYTLHAIGNREVTYVQNRWVFHKEIANSLTDACYTMMVWLLENGYIKKGE